MVNAYTERIRFSKLEEGDMFTFRKNGEVDDYDYSSECIRENGFVCVDNKCEDTNIITFWGSRYNIKNHRCFVWRLPHKDNGKSECKGCLHAWNFPNDNRCQTCSRRYEDNYVKGN